MPTGKLEGLLSEPPAEYQDQRSLILKAQVPKSREARIRLKKYWTERDFVSWESIENGELEVGKRGSLLGNMISFNMRKLLAQIQVRESNEFVDYDLIVNTIFQGISIWNYIFLQIEMYESCCYATTGERLPELWEQFEREAGSRIYWDFRLAANYWKKPIL